MILCYRSEDKRKSNDNTFGIPILNSVKTMEEEGLVLNRSLPNNREFDPFLLLDEFGPVDLAMDRRRDLQKRLWSGKGNNCNRTK